MQKATILFFSLIMAACGGSTENAIEETKESEATAETANASASEVKLYADDKMKFDKTEIKVKAGTTVTLTLTHTGTMAKATMGHNFVLLKPGTDLLAFTQDAAKAAKNEYIPENSEAVIAHTKLLGGGEYDTITFEAPASGTYDFLCSFPGHYALMKGKFIVE